MSLSGPLLPRYYALVSVYLSFNFDRTMGFTIFMYIPYSWRWMRPEDIIVKIKTMLSNIRIGFRRSCQDVSLRHESSIDREASEWGRQTCPTFRTLPHRGGGSVGLAHFPGRGGGWTPNKFVKIDLPRSSIGEGSIEGPIPQSRWGAGGVRRKFRGEGGSGGGGWSPVGSRTCLGGGMSLRGMSPREASEWGMSSGDEPY